MRESIAPVMDKKEYKAVKLRKKGNKNFRKNILKIFNVWNMGGLFETKGPTLRVKMSRLCLRLLFQ
jgi:hypothetical protein